MKLTNRLLSQQIAVALSSTWLATASLTAWSQEISPISAEPPSCANLQNYLDCTSKSRPEDVIFVFDTTGSMSDEITEMQTAVIEFSQTIAGAGIDYRLGLTEYKDFPNGSCGDPGDLPYNIYNGGLLTADETEMRSWIESLQASGGGDGPESILAALSHTMSDQQWRPAAGKVIIVISDAPAHPDDDGCNLEGDRIDDTIARLRGEGIVTHVIGPNEPSMQRLATETGGTFFEIRTTDSITEILEQIATLLSCTYHIHSSFAYKDDTLNIETRLTGAEGKTIPHITDETKLMVTACRDEVPCETYELTPTTDAEGTVYTHSATVTAFKDPATVTDFSTLVESCSFSTTTQATLHIGDCVAGETPIPQSPTLQVMVNGYDAQVSWSTDPYARGYMFFYAPFSDPISEVTLNNIAQIPMGRQTSLGGTLTSGTHLYTAVQASNCSGNSDFSNLGVVEIP